MTDKPSIESLRNNLDCLCDCEHGQSVLQAGERSNLSAALSELAALRESACRWYRADGAFEVLDPEEVIRRRKEAAASLESCRAENEALRGERDALKRRLREQIEFDKGVKDSLYESRAKMLERAEAAEARADALAARVEALKQVADEMLYQFSEPTHPGEECRRSGHVRLSTLNAWRGFFNSTPSADLEAHDARVKREALEGAWERIESEPEFPGEMPTEVWRQTRDATKEQFEAAMRGLLRAWKAKAKAAILGPNAQPNELEGK